MARTSKLGCSILGTSLAVLMSAVLLASASPASAAGKKKKAATEEADAPAADEEKSTDDLMEDATKKPEEKPAKKKSKKELAAEAEEEARKAEEEKKAATDAEIAATDADQWEPPPEEKAPPKQEAPKPVEAPFAEGRPFSVGLLVGYGFLTDRQTGGLGSDPYGFGFGLRGGYAFDFALYVGLDFKYYLGSSSEGGGGRVGTGVQTTNASSMQIAAEVGYEWWAGPVVIRPSLEIGAMIAFSDAMGSTRSDSGMLFGPGITVMVPIDEWFIGGDLRGSIVAGDGVNGVSLFATGGLRF